MATDRRAARGSRSRLPGFPAAGYHKRETFTHQLPSDAPLQPTMTLQPALMNMTSQLRHLRLAKSEWIKVTARFDRLGRHWSRPVLLTSASLKSAKAGRNVGFQNLKLTQNCRSKTTVWANDEKRQINILKMDKDAALITQPLSARQHLLQCWLTIRFRQTPRPAFTAELSPSPDVALRLPSQWS